MSKSVVQDVYAFLIEYFKVIFKEEIKKENSEKHVLQQQITSLKRVNLQIQNDLEELEQD